jgi:hypothetical protein
MFFFHLLYFLAIYASACPRLKGVAVNILTLVPAQNLLDGLLRKYGGLSGKLAFELEFISADGDQIGFRANMVVRLGDIQQKLGCHVVGEGGRLEMGREVLKYDITILISDVRVQKTDPIIFDDQVGQLGGKLQGVEKVRVMAECFVEICIHILNYLAISCSHFLEDVPGYAVVLPVRVAIRDQQSILIHLPSEKWMLPRNQCI